MRLAVATGTHCVLTQQSTLAVCAPPYVVVVAHGPQIDARARAHMRVHRNATHAETSSRGLASENSRRNLDKVTEHEDCIEAVAVCSTLSIVKRTRIHICAILLARDSFVRFSF